MKRRNSVTCLLRLLSTIPVVLIGAVVALYLLLLGWGMLMRIRWVNDRTCQFSTRAIILSGSTPEPAW